MKRIKTIVSLVAIIGLTASAQAGIFVKFDGIDGESLDQDHLGWSEIATLSHGLSRPSPGNGNFRRIRGPQLSDLTFVKEVDSATPKIAEAVAAGTLFESVEIHLTTSLTGDGNSGQQVTYYTYELTNVRVTSFQVSGSADGTPPTAQVSLNYEGIAWSYMPIKDVSKPPVSVVIGR